MDRIDLSDALEEAQRLLEAGDGAGAITLLDALPEGDAPGGQDAAETLLLRARAMIQKEAPGPALRCLLRAGEAGIPADAIDALYREMEGTRLPVEHELALLDWLAPQIARPAAVLRHARLLVRMRRFDEAEPVARRAAALDPASALAHRLIYVSVLRSDRPERAAEAIREALASPTKDPSYPALKMTLAGMEVEDRLALTEAIGKRWPSALGSAGRGGDLTLSGEGARGSKELQAYALALEGRLEEAAALAQEVEETNVGRHASVRKELASAVIAKVPGPEARLRPLIEDDGSEVVRSQPSQTGVTLLGLTDLAHQLGYPIRFVDAFCAATGAASLFLRDHSYRLFIGGVGSLAPDREGTIEALRHELVALKTERLIVVGQSSGGFSALRYGRELGAAEIYGFGIPSSIERFLTGPDSRARALIGKLRRTFPPEDLDLRTILPQIPSRAPIELYYGEDRDTDRGHAEDLEGMEGVTLHPQAGFNAHQVMPRLIADGRFQRWLEP
ncbi:tetratricopeptide repeat protein [Jannaschia seohaensis]|uniref:Tetratricopeptide repeat-containing protein n=1 Tax=Jannaschia seohaensis TaxID=475081 RepID=A0A2Y9B915_9RHOB|nr:tetratricopeptide repeat protein [Jannaschia seohaensis]PWJ12921.1 Tetratricopeptide repeat-containing protein [Jannaschia seohaensis]SSA50729.1 Tetratricopeptide repeat-containing protein [Jannaschia seohaensis]